MIEVITEGRVIKFDKEKKIIAFLNIKKMKKKLQMNRWEIPLGEPQLCVLGDYHRASFDMNNIIKPEILHKRIQENQKWLDNLIKMVHNA